MDIDRLPWEQTLRFLMREKDSPTRTAEEQADLPFPDCAKDCKAVEYLGVGECECVCPKKFNILS